MYPDFRDLLVAFNAKNVRYLIIGGYAVSLYVQPRSTKDLDLFIHADPNNASAVYQALAEYGAPVAEFTVADFSNPQTFLRFGREPQAVDLLMEVPGIDFESAWERRTDAEIAPSSGLVAHFLSREDLIASKLASGRLRDLADVEDLRNASELESEAP